MARQTTPAALMAIASTAMAVSPSPRIRALRPATITTSSFENVVPTAKLRNENIQSSTTVNRIWLRPPARQ